METAQESEAGRTGGWRAILTQVARPGQAPRPVSHLCCRERVDGEPSRTCFVRRVTRPHCHWTGLLVNWTPTGFVDTIGCGSVEGMTFRLSGDVPGGHAASSWACW